MALAGTAFLTVLEGRGSICCPEVAALLVRPLTIILAGDAEAGLALAEAPEKVCGFESR